MSPYSRDVRPNTFYAWETEKQTVHSYQITNKGNAFRHFFHQAEVNVLISVTRQKCKPLKQTVKRLQNQQTPYFNANNYTMKYASK